jgi:hypothetical protein
MIVDGQRQPKPPPLEELILLLHPQPVVRIIEGDEAQAAWNAWQDTTPDQLALT